MVGTVHGKYVCKHVRIVKTSVQAGSKPKYLTATLHKGSRTEILNGSMGVDQGTNDSKDYSRIMFKRIIEP